MNRLKNKPKSFLKDIFIYLIVLTGLIGIVLAFFLVSSYVILEKEISDSSNALLTLYTNDFENSISKMENYFTSIVIQDEELAKIKSDDENTRSLASMALHNYMQELMTDNEIADIIVVYDKKYNVNLDVIKRGFDFNQKILLRKYTQDAVNNITSNNDWNLLTIEDESYLYRMLLNDERAIAIYIKSDNLLNYLDDKGSSNRTIGLVSKEGVIGKLWGEKIEDINLGSLAEDISTKDYFIFKKGINKISLDMYCYVSKNTIFKQINISAIVVGIIVSLTFLFLLFMLKYVKKEISTPMHTIIGDMKIIKLGDYNNRIDGSFKTEEFQMLQETTNKMIDEIVGLKITSYEKKIELQEIELKSIRLQLKPHFFLNALSTISGLSIQNKNDLIINYISALSKNIRYMFSAGIHTVAIKDEIKHVQNYIEMQELKYPGCVFEFIDLPQECGDWQIPQMIIHTFVENIYKYAISIDAVITLLIKIRIVNYDKEEMMFIEIEDDGKGYPLEVIDSINANLHKQNNKGTSIGLWSIKRMMQIMYEREDLIYIKNVEPHGCYSRVIVPKQAKHEVKKEGL